MPSRMEKYSYLDENQLRSRKNQDLYKTIYDEVEYTNVEGISIIEKNENIDLDKIKELLTKDKPQPPRTVDIRQIEIKPKVVEEEQLYDINEVLSKAKSERPSNDNTQYNILKGLNLEQQFEGKKSIDDDELKTMIEAITVNSKGGHTSDLLDELKTIHDLKTDEIDKSFFTSSLGLTSKDFENLSDIKQEVKKNNILVKVILFVLSVVIVTGLMFVIYNFVIKR